MGVADNKTYRNQYHFTDNFKINGEEYPSINDEAKINTTIKENPYRSNVEIEGGEIVLAPDLSSLHKATGKRHSSGGMDVLLKPNSFIFSDYKGLSLTDKDHKLFELKEGGNYTPSNTTPAKVLKRNVNVKHYNTLVNNLLDTKKDDLARKSSTMMLDKYIQTLGNIAFAQEEKKNFPDGAPSFSAGTAPVYDTHLKEEIMENKQYMKYGGDIKQWGGLYGIFNRPTNPTTPVPPRKNRYSGVPQKYSGVPVPGMDKGDFGLIDKTGPLININWQQYPLEKPATTPTPNEVVGDSQGIKRADWQFTPWQKLSQAYNWSQYANAKRYMPYRSHYNATYTDPALLNPEQSIGDMKGVANQSVESLNTLSPILRNAQASSAYGQLLDQMAGVRNQYDNQNAQILNQTRQYNNQVKNNETQANLGFDQQYYQQAVTGRQNFDNMRNYLSNQAINETMRDVEANQRLSYNLLTQNNPAYGFDWKSGNFTRNPKSVLDVTGQTPQDTLEAMFDYAKKLKDSGLDVSVQSALLKGQYFKQIAPFLMQSGTPPPFKKGGKMKNPWKY
jgi:hypothetical protein